MRSEYRALVDKVGAFTRAAFERRRADMACRAGCDACCQVWLTVSAVEAAEVRGALVALPPAARERVAQRAKHERARERAAGTTTTATTTTTTTTTTRAPRCAMLEPDGRCAIYEARPLVCRTQGHALRYPPGFIPADSVRARAASGEVTHCPLNFTRNPPAGEDVLDAERVDQLLGLVNHRFAQGSGEDSAVRYALSELGADTGV